MLIVRISSGLGNQMFQYALCCVFREKGITVKADTSVFSKKKEQRAYELEKVFGISIPAASAFEKGVMNAVSKISFKLLDQPYKEQDNEFGIWKQGITGKKWGYVNGYWQSEKYFKHIGQTVRNEFTFSPPADEQNIDLLTQINNCNSISIHIRRTDYVSGFKWGLSAAYYREAIQLITSKVKNPQFYFFSDDMAWVKQHFSSGNFHYVDCNKGVDSFRDMQLMSNCKHHIIANSTFSWWGAWLNPSKEKMVIAPDAWLPHTNGTRDIVPAEWIKIPVTLGG